MDKKEIIALSLAKEISNKELLFFIDNFESIDHIGNSKIGKTFKQKFDKDSLFDSNNEYIDKAELQLELADKYNSNIITILDDNYPILLKNITDPPPVLYYKGTIYDAEYVSISIVGTRKATNYGRLVVEKFVNQLVENRVIITSGLAYGIDSYAHDRTLQCNGTTYAVIASGIDKISTDRSKKLSNKIIDSGGCIISSYPFGINALPPYFINRNRIISGISKATIVIESDAKGGSLWTAKFAVEQNRDLFAVPGNIFESKSKGTNTLIEKDMAIPALSVDQILNHIGFSNISNNSNVNSIEFNNTEEEKIFNYLSFSPKHIDEIANAVEMPIMNVQVNLLTLEFNSMVRQLPGNLFIRNID
jgi:DNA processing protein